MDLKKLDEPISKIKDFLAQFENTDDDTLYLKAKERICAEIAAKWDKPFNDEQLLSLQESIDSISERVFKSYLPRIETDFYPCKLPEQCKEEAERLRILKIGRWVTDPSEHDIDKLKNTYNVLSASPCRFALIFNCTRKGYDVYMAVYSTENSDDPSVANSLINRFKQSLKGNFPGVSMGSSLTDISKIGIREKNAVAVVTNIASEKSEKFISQGIEKLIDAYTPMRESSEYTLMLLCEPLSSDEIKRQKEIVSQYYTALSPFATWQTNANSSETVSRMESVSTGRNLNGSINIGIPHIMGATAAYGANRQDQHGINDSYTGGRGSTLSYTNHQVKTLLERLDEQMKKLAQCEALGMWRFAAYVLSDEYSVAENIAQMYRSLTQGNSSYIEQTAVNIWGNLDEKNDSTRKILFAYLKQLEHPLFKRNLDDSNEEPVYASSFISGTEVAQALNMPRKSIPGLPVFQCAEFARNVISVSDKSDEITAENERESKHIDLGSIVHMRNKEATSVCLNKSSLTSHTFITGSTGSGKSNTVYTLLDKLCLSANTDRVPRFLVIEPAKGEYKEVLGGYEDVFVYGTNQSKTPLLRLNPFSFPSDTHVLEHIDRLIEIFNACWPMYAAMPAVLKAAVERAYTNAGWSLTASICLASAHPNKRFPTFRDVMKALPEVIDSKGFSKDTQGDYKGALLTRVESLTNGINGQVLCAYNELTAEELFDCNVIVDLSRVGSMETKALLMGILILKLREHRMAQRSEGKNHPNSGLSHITVLEEAHNLLRCTSSEQTQDSSNLQGKSVEMLANAIAELRSFGEGFIIADQAPGLLDMAVIRNTNTKIIMRLPDEGDRQLVGKAAGLNDDQIAELSKLETGVAAVYQNEWLEPVLCKVEEFADSDDPKKEKRVRPYSYQQSIDEEKQLQKIYLQNLITPPNEVRWFSMDEVDQISRWIDWLDTSAAAKEILYRGIKENLSATEKGYALYCAIKGKVLLERTKSERNKDMIPAIMDANIMNTLDVGQAIAEEIRRIVCYYAAEQVRGDEVYYNDLRQYGSVM
ncbi:ATP-binding protein [Pelosinus sp. sgz500959]|uniref:ATP-binding protein n=1 Tax=Pelosinus sp. sgz500959 TaxID=3242472 RepID=UPI00367032B6